MERGPFAFMGGLSHLIDVEQGKMARKVIADKRHGGGKCNFLIRVCVGKIDITGTREHASQTNIRESKLSSMHLNEMTASNLCMKSEEILSM